LIADIALRCKRKRAAILAEGEFFGDGERRARCEPGECRKLRHKLIGDLRSANQRSAARDVVVAIERREWASKDLHVHEQAIVAGRHFVGLEDARQFDLRRNRGCSLPRGKQPDRAALRWDESVVEGKLECRDLIAEAALICRN